jgi:hypothetical protein
VYKFDFTHLTDNSPKLTPKWEGPYKLKYFVGNNTARFENIFTGKEEGTIVNLDHLKTANARRQILRKFWPSHGTSDIACGGAINQADN